MREARNLHHLAYNAVELGRDPLEERQEDARKAKLALLNTFALMGRAWHKHMSSGWSDNHAQTILRRLENDLFSEIGNRPLLKITSEEILDALQKIEERGSNEVARRCKQYAWNIFSFAKKRKLIPNNPVDDLDGMLQPFQRGQFPSLTLEELPEFIKHFERNEARLTIDTRDAMQSLMLTLVRTTELLGSKWPEFDLESRMWVVPGTRMKRKKGLPPLQDHLVPLSSQMVELLKKRKRKNDLLPLDKQSQYVFPSINKGPQKHLHKRTIGKALFSMGYQGKHTGHGFRALGMGIAKEKLRYEHDIIDRQLAHIPLDELKRAYDRAKYLPQRTEMMQRLADYIDGLQKPTIEQNITSMSSPQYWSYSYRVVAPYVYN